MKEVTELFKDFRKLGLNYLDELGYNEVEYHDNKEIKYLYENMYKCFQKDFMRFMECEEVIFNYFATDDDNSVIVSFYEPQNLCVKWEKLVENN